MTSAGRETGRRGEDIAAAFLKKRGMKILARNVCLHGGEIDCIARDGTALVFVEVKTEDGRSGDWNPENRVNARKRRQLVKLALAYMRRHGIADVETRFDVVAVRISADGPPEINHFPDAFDAAEKFQPYDN